MFMTTLDSCAENKCIGIHFDIGADLRYQLSYSVFDESSGDLLVEFEDEGSYVLDCEDSGFLSGRYSSLKYMEGMLILNSDFFSSKTIQVEVNGVQGLTLDPNVFELRDSVNNLLMLSRL